MSDLSRVAVRRVWPRKVLTCQIEECGSPHHALGLCKKHYQRWRLHGDPYFSQHANAKPYVYAAEKKLPRYWPTAKGVAVVKQHPPNLEAFLESLPCRPSTLSKN